MQTENGHFPNFALLRKQLLLTEQSRTMEGELPGHGATMSNSEREHSQPQHLHKRSE